MAARACKASRRKEGALATGDREGGVDNRAKERKGWALFFNFLSRNFTRIMLVLLVFLGVVGICSGCIILGLKGNNLFFLPLCSN